MSTTVEGESIPQDISVPSETVEESIIIPDNSGIDVTDLSASNIVPPITITSPEATYVEDISRATCGQDLIDATEKYSSIDKTNGSIAYNRAKRFLVEHNLISAERFARGGYGKMPYRDRVVIHSAIKASEGDVFREIQQAFLPPTKPLSNTAYKRPYDINTDGIWALGVNPYKRSSVESSLEIEANVANESTKAADGVNSAQIGYLREQTASLRAQRLRDALTHQSVELFAPEIKEKLKELYLKAVLEGLE